MPTVQQAVDILTAVTGESRRHVNVVARRLIDDGVLPKSVGSRVAQTDLKGVLAHARRHKMIYLQEAALSKVLNGETTIEEVIRTTAPAKAEGSAAA